MTPDALECTCFLIFSFVLAGIAQTLWLRFKGPRWLTRPIDAGRKFRGHQLFGPNKTFKGFVGMVPFVACSFVIVSILAWFGFSPSASIPFSPWQLSLWNVAWLGASAGLGYMLGELPNSFMKRQFGIEAGEAPKSTSARWFCFVADQSDSVFGALLGIVIWVPVPWLTWLILLLLGPVVHWVFNLILMLMGIKERAA